MKNPLHLVFLLGALALLSSGCRTTAPTAAAGPSAIRVSVFYPHMEGARFDWVYYTETHLPLVSRRFGPAMRRLTIDEGLAGGTAGAPPAFVAVAHMTFDSLEAFQAATGPHIPEIMADIPKFTSIQPVIQISRLKVDR